MRAWFHVCCGSAVQDRLQNVQQLQSSHGAFTAILADGAAISWGPAKHGGDSRDLDLKTDTKGFNGKPCLMPRHLQVGFVLLYYYTKTSFGQTWILLVISF